MTAPSLRKLEYDLDVNKTTLHNWKKNRPKLYEFIIENYEEKMIQNVKKYILKNDIHNETLEKMAEIFKVLGYFNMDSILKGKMKGLFK